MKKILLTISACIAMVATASAQLALEDFNGGVLPAGWVEINDGNTVSTAWGGATIANYLDTAAWMPFALFTATPSDYQMMTTSYFNPSATADRWLITPAFLVNDPNMVIQWQDVDIFGSGETLQVLVSPTGDTTKASFTATIHSAAASPSFGIGQAVVGTTYNGQTIRVAFRDHVNDGYALALDNVQTVILPSYDLGVNNINVLPYVKTGASTTIRGSVHNYGVAVITALNVNYSINGGAPVTTTTTGTNIILGNDYNFTSTTPWVPSTPGVYTLKVWTDNFNGSNPDAVHTNDTQTVQIAVVDPSAVHPKRVMIEEFTQASCDPCANAHVNVDTVYTNNMSTASLVRYHVNFPGRDCMDTVTLSPFVSDRLSFYQVSGVPDAQVDGTYVYPGHTSGGLSTPILSAASAIGSPLTINITSTNYNATTHAYSFSADIKAFGDMPAGMKAYAVLVVDTLVYALNQSTESIAQTIFPQVAENIFPSSSGTTLNAFTSGSTQTFTSSWVKNHRWGSNYSVWAYDSTSTGKIVVFVQNSQDKFTDYGFIFQTAEAAVATGPVSVNVNTTSATIENVDIYPNPASTAATLALTLKSAADVKVDIYNIMGQIVYSKGTENRNAGSSNMTIDVSNFASGNYFVKVSIGGELVTKKLTITK